MSNRHVRTFEVHRYAENGERGKAQFLLLPREDLWMMRSVANIQCCQFSVFNANVEYGVLGVGVGEFLVGVWSWSGRMDS